MDTLLVFIVLPLATFIFSIALRKILKTPLLVSAIGYSVFLIIAFVAFQVDTASIVAAIIYAVIALITALIVNIICSIIDRLCNNRCNNNNNNDSANEGINDNNNWPNTRACRICRCQRNILRNFGGR